MSIHIIYLRLHQKSACSAQTHKYGISLCRWSPDRFPHTNKCVCLSDSITAELKTPTSFLTVRSSLWRVSASGNTHKTGTIYTIDQNSAGKTIQKHLRHNVKMFIYRFSLLPPAMIVAMDPVSCLNVAPLPSAECCSTAMCFVTPPSSSHTPLKDTRRAVIGWPRNQYKHQCNSLYSKVHQYNRLYSKVVQELCQMLILTVFSLIIPSVIISHDQFITRPAYMSSAYKLDRN